MEATASSPAASLFDQMVDRYLDVTTWPPARKTALLMGIALPFHLVLLCFSLIALRSPETPVNVKVFTEAQLGFLAATAATFAVATWADRRGSAAEARAERHAAAAVSQLFAPFMVTKQTSSLAGC